MSTTPNQNPAKKPQILTVEAAKNIVLNLEREPTQEEILQEISIVLFMMKYWRKAFVKSTMVLRMMQLKRRFTSYTILRMASLFRKMVFLWIICKMVFQ